MHIRLVNVYLLNVPSVSSPYFNKIKRTSHLGKWHALLLEILNDLVPTFVLLKYIIVSLLARPTHFYIRKMLTNKEMVNFQKWDFSRFIL